MKLAYFVQDLTDPAVPRRVRMLRAGGAEPVVLGFRRNEACVTEVAGAPAVDLGRTYDLHLGQRAWKTAVAALGARRLRDRLAGVQVVMARSLEMLTVAQAGRRACAPDARLVYECLDIHRLLLSPGAKGRALRAMERSLMRQADLLIVSSPAFLPEYFSPLQGVGATIRIPTLLVENKVLDLGAARPERPAKPPGPPWRIGWLGALRCSRSLDILTRLAARRPDLVEVAIHGRPTYGLFDDFDGQVAAVPNVSFHGPYRAEDLPGLYGRVHFSWAVDYMEEGQNSAWLLPNRVYESGRYGAPPIALRGVQTGRYLAERGIGVRLDDPAELEGFLDALTPELYGRLQAQLDAVPAGAFVADEADCRRLVDALAGGVRDACAEPARPPAKLVA